MFIANSFNRNPVTTATRAPGVTPCLKSSSSSNCLGSSCSISGYSFIKVTSFMWIFTINFPPLGTSLRLFPTTKVTNIKHFL